MVGWIVTGLVVVLAALTVVIVRNTAQPEPPDLTPVEVTPHPSSTSEPARPPESPGGSSGGDGADSTADANGSADDAGANADGAGADREPPRIERSYEPAPNPPREVPDGDDDDDDVGDGEEVEDSGDDDDD